MSENEQGPVARKVQVTILEVPAADDPEYGLVYSHHSHSEDEDHIVLSVHGGMGPDDVPAVLRMLLAMWEQPDVQVQLAAGKVINEARVAGHGE